MGTIFDGSFNKIKSFLKSELSFLEQELLSIKNHSDNALITKSIDKILSGGKRIRPIVLLLCYKLLLSNGDGSGLVQSLPLLQNQSPEKLNNNNHANTLQTAIKCSTVIELIHNASLFHDDVIDEAKLRRGEEVINKTLGNKETILVGDFLFAKSFDIISQIQNFEIIKILSGACLSLTLGEVVQLYNKANYKITTEQYYSVIYSKTASLFEASSSIAAVLCSFSVTSEQFIKMKRFGYLIGMAFQIIDDILDYEEHKSFGKETGKDFFEGKVTLPLVITIQNLQKNDLQIITDIFNSKSFNKESFELIRKLIKSTNSIEQCRKVVSGFLFDASQILSSFSHSKERSLLIDLIDFFEKRFV